MTDSISSIPYINDILHQPQALQATLSVISRFNPQGIINIQQQIAAGKIRRIILTGMGSSYHAQQPLRLALLRQGLPVLLLETSELIHQTPDLLTQDTLTVAVSQSGESVEILQLIRQCPEKAAIIGVTNSPESRLARRANALLLTHAGDEKTVSCKTYVTCLALLAVLEALLTGQETMRVLSDLAGIPEAVSTYLSAMQEHLEVLEQLLREVHYVILAGRGVSLAATGTGGLIIKEAAHFPAEGMSCAAFRHGPLDMASPQTFVLVYEGLAPTREINQNLVADIRTAGGQAALVATAHGEGVFNLPLVAEAGLPVLEILPAQMISVALARLQDHIPGKFTWGKKVTSTE